MTSSTTTINDDTAFIKGSLFGYPRADHIQVVEHTWEPLTKWVILNASKDQKNEQQEEYQNLHDL